MNPTVPLATLLVPLSEPMEPRKETRSPARGARENVTELKKQLLNQGRSP